MEVRTIILENLGEARRNPDKKMKPLSGRKMLFRDRQCGIVWHQCHRLTAVCICDRGNSSLPHLIRARMQLAVNFDFDSR